MRFSLIIAAFSLVTPAIVFAQQFHFPEQGLSFVLPTDDPWVAVSHEADGDSITLNYQSQDGTRTVWFSVSPTSATLEDVTERYVNRFLTMWPGRVLSEASGRLDQLPAKRFQLDHGHPDKIAKSMLVVAVEENRAYAVSLRSTEREPLEDDVLRAIGASIRVRLPTSPQGLAAEHSMETWQAAAAVIAQRYGVTIVFDEIVFPAYWRDWQPRFQRVPEHTRLAAIRRLSHDLSHYEPPFVRRHLDKIFLYDHLEFGGQEYGGTNDHKHRWLYLHINWLGDDGRHDKAMGFHHEFSSILLKMHQDRFPERRWRGENPRSFRYAFQESLETNLQTGQTDLLGNDKVYRQGFICSYGQLTLEDDVNTFAQLMIAKPALLEKLGSAHRPIRNKANLLQDFYNEIGYRSPR